MKVLISLVGATFAYGISSKSQSAAPAEILKTIGDAIARSNKLDSEGYFDVVSNPDMLFKNIDSAFCHECSKSPNPNYPNHYKSPFRYLAESEKGDVKQYSKSSNSWAIGVAAYEECVGVNSFEQNVLGGSSPEDLKKLVKTKSSPTKYIDEWGQCTENIAVRSAILHLLHGAHSTSSQASSTIKSLENIKKANIDEPPAYNEEKIEKSQPVVHTEEELIQEKGEPDKITAVVVPERSDIEIPKKSVVVDTSKVSFELVYTAGPISVGKLLQSRFTYISEFENYVAAKDSRRLNSKNTCADKIFNSRNYQCISPCQAEASCDPEIQHSNGIIYAMDTVRYLNGEKGLLKLQALTNKTPALKRTKSDEGSCDQKICTVSLPICTEENIRLIIEARQKNEVLKDQPFYCETSCFMKRAMSKAIGYSSNKVGLVKSAINSVSNYLPTWVTSAANNEIVEGWRIDTLYIKKSEAQKFNYDSTEDVAVATSQCYGETGKKLVNMVSNNSNYVNRYLARVQPRLSHTFQEGSDEDPKFLTSSELNFFRNPKSD